MARVKPRTLSKSKREGRINHAIVKRREEGTPWAELEIEFRIPRSTLNDRWNGAQNRYDAQIFQQKLPPSAEKALEAFCKQLDDWGFPPRLDLLRGMALSLAQIRAEKEEDPELA